MNITNELKQHVRAERHEAAFPRIYEALGLHDPYLPDRSDALWLCQELANQCSKLHARKHRSTSSSTASTPTVEQRRAKLRRSELAVARTPNIGNPVLPEASSDSAWQAMAASLDRHQRRRNNGHRLTRTIATAAQRQQQRTSDRHATDAGVGVSGRTRVTIVSGPNRPTEIIPVI